MLLSALTRPHPRPGESALINALFAAGLAQLYLRKPRQDAQVFQRILEGIDPAYLDRIVLHQHYGLLKHYPLKGLHFSRTMLREGWLGEAWRAGTHWNHRVSWTSATFYSLEQLASPPRGIQHSWLSPAFQSISAPDAGPGFSSKGLERVLKSTPNSVHAMGGINPQTAREAKTLGFSGVVLQGYLWRSKDPVDALHLVQQAMVQTVPMLPKPAPEHA